MEERWMYSLSLAGVLSFVTGSHLNRQHVPSVDQSELAGETERLDREWI